MRNADRTPTTGNARPDTVGGASARGAHGLLVLAMIILTPARSPAQTTTPDSARVVAIAAAAAPAPLIFGTDTIAIFRATVAGVPPDRRAEIAENRLESLRRDQMLQPVRTQPMEGGYFVLLGDTFVFFIMNGDVDPAAGQTVDQLARDTADRLSRSLAGRARLLTASGRWRAILISLGATLVLFVLIEALRWAGRKLPHWITTRAPVLHGRLRFGGLDVFAQFSTAISWLFRIAVRITSFALVLLWVLFVLSQFPETSAWGAAAFSSLFTAVAGLRHDVLRAIPGLVTVAMIIVIARFATESVGGLFTGIERGTVQVPAIHPETAGATRRLVNLMIWLFAIVVAYPLVPGSGSEAFKGVSVFLGLLITLGSSGVVGHLMSGLVLIYSRALRPGDVVRVQDIEGIVTEVGALSVKIANARKEEFTIPNTVIVGNTVKNFSRLARDTGPVLTTSVTIGYDAPWRVVYEMLFAAAERTAGIRKQPAPMVFQPSLSDFFVEYQLVVRVEATADRFKVLSELHQNIQDAFNDRGVQIMSPHFESQPDRPILVPKARWSEAPNDRPGSAASR